MLVLQNSYIKSILELENALTVRVREEVPFTTNDLVNGFNSPTSTFENNFNQVYPKIEDVVFVLFAFLKPYEPLETEQIELSVRRVNYVQGERTLTQTEFGATDFSYSSIAYLWDIELGKKQGVIETYMLSLPKDDINSKFYYNTTTDKVMEVILGESVEVLDTYDLVKRVTNKATKKCLLIPFLSYTFSLIEKKLLFLRKDKCEDEKLIQHLMGIENLVRISANVATNQAEVKMYSKAQEAIELIEKIIEENEHLWK